MRSKRYYGEEAERLTPAEARRFEKWLASATPDELLACEVPPPARPVAIIQERSAT